MVKPGGFHPPRTAQSVGWEPAAFTRTRTSPGPASGVGTSISSRTSGPPNAWNAAAFMVNTPLQQRFYGPQALVGAARET